VVVVVVVVSGGGDYVLVLTMRFLRFLRFLRFFVVFFLLLFDHYPAMELVDGVKGCSYLLDAKAITKEELYGSLDATTLEWTDGIFTHTLRTIINNVRGESAKRHWIIFDCDVDPEWAENLNSVLDDNKLLTLPR
jgi:hypothetical protein